MGVFDGQPVDAAVTNPAFINKNQDDTTPSRLGLGSTAPDQGTAVIWTQQEINAIDSFIGKARNTAATALPPWMHNDVGTSIDPLFQRLDAITLRFSGVSGVGHQHSGADGDGPPISLAGVSNSPPLPFDVADTAALGATGNFAWGSHVHRGVHSIAVTGSSELFGDITLQASTGISLSQAGQTISIAATGGGNGAGGTGKNYISTYLGNPGNGDFELGNTSGWSLFNTTLTGVIPTGTISAGASSFTTFTTVSSGQLAGDDSLSVAASTAFSAGQGFITDAFTIDLEDHAKVLGISCSYEAFANASNMNFSGTSSNTWAMYLYDVTNAAWIQPAGVYNFVQNSGVGKMVGTFQTTSNSTQYRLAIICINSSSGPATMYWDDFSFGPQISVNAPAVSDFQSYTPAGNWNTNTNYTGQWRRVGDSMEVTGSIDLTGSPNAAQASFTIPSGFTIDTTKLASSSADRDSLGVAIGQDTGVGQYIGTVFMIDTQTVGFGGPVAGAAWSDTVPFSWVNTDHIDIHFFVPIVGWSSNSVSSSDTDTRVCASRGHQTSNQVIPASTPTVINFDITDFDTHGVISNPTTNWTFTAPISGIYKVESHLHTDAAAWTIGDSLELMVYLNASEYASLDFALIEVTGTQSLAVGGSTLIECHAGDEIQILADTSRATGISFAASGVFNYASINRLSGPAVILATDTVAARYTGASVSVPNGTDTVIPFANKDYDTTLSYNTSTGLFTCPDSGKYDVSAIVDFQISTSGQRQLEIYKNGSLFSILAFREAGVTGSSNSTVLNGSDTVNCLAGDTLGVYVFQASGGALTVGGATDIFNRIVVKRVGN